MSVFAKKFFTCLSQFEKIAKNSVNAKNVNFSSTFEQKLKITTKKIVVYVFLQFTNNLHKKLLTFDRFSCQVFCDGFSDEFELKIA